MTTLSPADRRRGPAAGLAPAAPAQPARPVGRGRGVRPPPELRGDGSVEAQPRARAPPGRAPRRAAARAELAAARGGLLAGVPGAVARRRGHGSRARRARPDPRRPRAVPGGDRRPALGPRDRQQRPRSALVHRRRRRRTCSSRRSTCTASGLHPDGLAPRVAQLRPSTASTSSPSCSAMSRSAATPTSPRCSTRCGATPASSTARVELTDPAPLLFLPIELEQPDGTVLSLFSTIATFGTALDVTLAELSHRGSSSRPTRPPKALLRPAR